MQAKRVQILTAAMLSAALAALVLVSSAIGAAQGAASTASPQGGATPVNADNPYDLVESAANSMLQQLDARRAEYRSDPAKLRGLVDQVLLPHFDSQFAARAVLGTHWRAATPDQRQRFVDAFYNSLLNNYGNALLDFTADRVQVLPFRGQPNSEYAVVHTRVRKSDGSMVQVDYSLRHADQGWKVWDVVVEGISYDKSFQEDFSEQIDRQGIDAVIAHLQHGETPAAIKRTAGS